MKKTILIITLSVLVFITVIATVYLYTVNKKILNIKELSDSYLPLPENLPTGWYADDQNQR